MTPAGKRCVVIGAGMGGLASAMRLAHAGLSVTLIDSQESPGGKMRTLPSAAGPVDTGPTVLTMRHVFDELFSDVGLRLDDHITLKPEPILARHFWPDGSRLDLVADQDRSVEAIRAFAGDKAAHEYAAFAQHARMLFEAFDGPIMQNDRPQLAGLIRHVGLRPNLARAMAPGQTLARRLARQFSDPRLRQLFGRYATYVGGSPYASPAVLALVSHSEAMGVWRVEGGMHVLADAMCDAAWNLGARVVLGATASRIETQGGAVRAVQLADGGRLPCDLVVFNGDPRALQEGYLGPAPRQAVKTSGVSPRSLSANVWAFAARYSGPELAHHNVFFGADPRTEFGPIASGSLPEDPTLYICAQDRTESGAANELERFEIIMNAPPRADGEDEEIETCRTRTFQTLARHGVRFSPEPDDRALTTPPGFDRLFPASQGSLYGLSPHGMMAAFNRPSARTSLPGLYLAGGGAHPGAGVPMATLSGRHAAAAILTDLTSTSKSRPMDTPGGISTASAIVAPAPSRSSPS